MQKTLYFLKKVPILTLVTIKKIDKKHKCLIAETSKGWWFYGYLFEVIIIHIYNNIYSLNYCCYINNCYLCIIIKKGTKRI